MGHATHFLQRLERLPNVIFDLAFSQDGQRLAAFLEKSEVHVWDIAGSLFALRQDVEPSFIATSGDTSVDGDEE